MPSPKNLSAVSQAVLLVAALYPVVNHAGVHGEIAEGAG